MTGKTVLIVGSSVAGTERALLEAQAGNKVYLVEQSLCLARDRIILDDDFSGSPPFLSPRIEELRNNPNVEVIADADIEQVSGEAGNFKVRISRRSSRVIAGRCDDCRACITVCPVNIPDESSPVLCRTAIDSCMDGTGGYNILKQDMPPCQEACPLHLDVRGYVGRIADGEFAEALALIREKLPFPGVIGHICSRPCERQCSRSALDRAVSICSLKRFVADFKLRQSGSPMVPEKNASRAAMVAIIGSGPAGLTCAHDLAQAGHGVTVFEALPVAGGMLAVGIPDYRLPKAVLQREIEGIRSLGVEIKVNTSLGGNLTIDELFRQGFKAIFIATGAHRSQKLQVTGEDAEGVVPGLDLLRDLNLGREVRVGGKVLVIGGGNVAVDAARSAIRLGAAEVSILYRRTREEMPAYEDEIAAAEAEGVRIRYLTAPVEVITNGGRARGLSCIQMKMGKPDASGRRQPIPIRGSEFSLELDTLILAIGQRADLSFLRQNDHLQIASDGTMHVEPATMVTSRAGVFAGGDAVTGPATAIEAIAAGKKAASSISRYLEEEAQQS